MNKIICNKCGYSINLNDDFLISINTHIKGINYENIKSILPRLKCSECGSKDISITPNEEKKLRENIIEVLKHSKVSTIENFEDKHVNDISKIQKNNKWDYGVDENDKIIPFSTQQQHSGKTSIDKYRKDYRKL